MKTKANQATKVRVSVAITKFDLRHRYYCAGSGNYFRLPASAQFKENIDIYIGS